MLNSIVLGDRIRCLECKEVFILENIGLNTLCEYIHCPVCGSDYDTHYYHLYGEKIEEPKIEIEIEW